MNDYEQYLETWNGRELLKKYNLKDSGLWNVYGEDPNCDLGGPHHEPYLGLYRGTLRNIIADAVNLPRFYTWGGGGRIEKVVVNNSPEDYTFSRLELFLEELRVQYGLSLETLDNIAHKVSKNYTRPDVKTRERLIEIAFKLNNGIY